MLTRRLGRVVCTYTLPTPHVTGQSTVVNPFILLDRQRERGGGGYSIVTTTLASPYISQLKRWTRSVYLRGIFICAAQKGNRIFVHTVTGHATKKTEFNNPTR